MPVFGGGEGLLAKYALRVEGVDFDATIGDTHNLSAYRGGSLALLAAPDGVAEFLNARDIRSERIFAGASQGAWTIEVCDFAAAQALRKEIANFLASGGPPRTAAHVWPHLAFVVDVAPGEQFRDLKTAEAMNRERQFRRANWMLPAYQHGVQTSHATLDRMRPASVDCEVKGETARVSPSFKARFEFGRDQRERFYASEAGSEKAQGLTFAKSFEDIIDDAPNALPASVGGKLAVFYADGNRFGKVREQAGSVAEYRKFSDQLRAYQRALLGHVLEWLRAGAKGEHWQAYLQASVTARRGSDATLPLRFETLQWGGDELTFVMPAWLGVAFAQAFFSWTRDWIFNGTALTFAAGLVLCHDKTPIRQARRLAKALADDAKETMGVTPENRLQIDAFESIALPEHVNELTRYRTALFGLDVLKDEKLRRQQLGRIAAWQSLHVAGANQPIAAIAALKDENFPRSQVYNLLRTAATNGSFLPDGPPLDDAATIYLKRMGLKPEADLPRLRVLGDCVPLAYSLAAIATLWDYIEPLAGLGAVAAEDAA
jgi:hypothetical protein